MVNETFENLKKALSQYVTLQKENPELVVELIDENEFDENLSIKECGGIAGLTLSIHNCLFRNDTGKEVFPGTTNDNKPHIMIQKMLNEDDDKEQIARIVENKISSYFSHTREVYGRRKVVWHYFRCDLGEDVDTAVNLCKELCINIEEIPISRVYRFKAILVQCVKKGFFPTQKSLFYKSYNQTKKQKQKKHIRNAKKEYWTVTEVV